MKRKHALRLAAVVVSVLGMMTAEHLLGAVPEAMRPAVVVNGGNWWDAPAAQPQQPVDRRVADRDDVNHALPRREGTIMDYPGAQMGDWVVANAMAARARAVEVRAGSELSFTILRVQRHFEHSSEYLKAVAEEKQAYADFTAARQKAILSVAGDPKYHALGMLRDELADKIARRRFAKDITVDEIAVMATLKMQYAADARAMEVIALNADDTVKAARDKMEQASRRLVELKARFEDAIHDNPEVILARRALDDARISVVETSALASSTSIAGAYAINFAYYLHRNDLGSAFGPYGPNGGGISSGYSSPYWH